MSTIRVYPASTIRADELLDCTVVVPESSCLYSWPDVETRRQANSSDWANASTPRGSTSWPPSPVCSHLFTQQMGWLTDNKLPTGCRRHTVSLGPEILPNETAAQGSARDVKWNGSMRATWDSIYCHVVIGVHSRCIEWPTI